MVPPVTRLSPENRRLLQTGAVLCWIVGAILLVIGFIDFFASFNTRNAPTKFWMFFLGMPFLIAGSFMGRFGFAKPVSEIFATETAGAIHVTASAAGAGLREGLGGPLGSSPTIRVRCRTCGFLESEDARFCSGCRAEM